MARPKGSIKTGGRKKGTPNKKTSDLMNVFAENKLDVPTKISQLLPQLTPDRQADILIKLLEYLYPKRRYVESKADDDYKERYFVPESLR